MDIIIFKKVKTRLYHVCNVNLIVPIKNVYLSFTFLKNKYKHKIKLKQSYNSDIIINR